MRPRRKRLIGAVAALGLMVAGGTAWAAPQQVGRYANWFALRDDDAQPRQCFLALPPSVSVPSVPGRGRAALVVRHVPGDADSVLLLPGLPTQGMVAEVSIDGQAFPFTPTASGLVASDAAPVLAAMNAGGTLAMRLIDRGQTLVEDHYPLAGFAQGYRESRAGCDGTPVAPAAAAPTMPSVTGPAGTGPTISGPSYSGGGYSAGGRHEVPLHHKGSLTTVSAAIDGGTHVEFILDSGASSVVIPEDVYERMQTNGASPPILGRTNARIADGSIVQNRLIRLESLQIGGVTISNVLCQISPRGADALLGQTVLQRLPNWSVDNQRGVLSWGP